MILKTNRINSVISCFMQPHSTKNVVYVLVLATPSSGNKLQVLVISNLKIYTDVNKKRES